jgi:hypothetical protein
MNAISDATRSAIVESFRFMRLFNISFFSVLKAEEGIVRALVAWPDDCKDGFPSIKTAQEIEWRSTKSEDRDDALTAAEWAYDNGWIRSDKLHLDKARLQRALGWDSQRLSRAVEILLKLRAERIDDGTGGDAFLLHSPTQ